MIKLKPGQTVILEDGSKAKIEEGDVIQEKFRSSYINPKAYEMLYQDIIDWLEEGKNDPYKYGANFANVLNDLVFIINKDTDISTTTLRNFKKGISDNI